MPYLYMFGDPIPGYDGVPGKDVVNLEQAVPYEQIADYRIRFRMMPRQVFDVMMAQAIANTDVQGNLALALKSLNEMMNQIDKKTIYALMLDLFNEVNQAAMIENGISDPWVWEAKKMEALYHTQANADLAASSPDLFLQTGDGTDYTKIIMREALEKRAVKVSEKIPDEAYKIQFLLSIKFLLDKESFSDCDLILKAYESLNFNDWEAVKIMFPANM